MNAAAVTGLNGYTIPVSAKTVWIIVELQFGEAASGWGEATLSGAEEAVLAELAHARTLLVEAKPTTPGAAAALLRMAHASRARLTVARAIEQAFLDAMARRAGLSLSALMGGLERREVPVYANINRGITDRSPEGFGHRAREVAGDGFRAVKIAPFDGLHWSRTGHRDAARLLAVGIDRIKAVRDAVGPGVDLLVDCHSRLSPVMARTVLREAEPAGLFWLEEALDEESFDPATSRALRSHANDRGVRVAGGEHLASMEGARDLLARAAYDVILPDLRWTGIRTGMAILELAAASGVAASLHNPVGPVLDRVSTQVAAALPAFLILERQVRESPLFDEVLGGPPAMRDGAAIVTDAPGLGAEPDRALLERCARQGFVRPATLAALPGAGGDA